MYKVKEVDKKEVWEDFVLRSNPRSFLQSWNWGESNRIVGNNVYRLGYYGGNRLVGVCLLISQKAKRGAHLLVPGGPVIDWGDKKMVGLFVESIKECAQKERAWFIRVRPELEANESNKLLFRKLGFIGAPMHLHAENTWILDIEPSEEKLLYGMRKQTRYSVRQSLKWDLKVEKTVDVRRVSVLTQLQKETARRHGFVPFPVKLFKAQMETFGKDNEALLFVVKYKKKILSAAIIIFYGDTAYYHHSASSSKFLKIPSSYFLQWSVIQEAKKRGMKYYNFWGISPSNDPSHRFFGVTIFKTGFGGERVDWLHAQDLAVSNKYWLTFMFETVRRRMRGL